MKIVNASYSGWNCRMLSMRRDVSEVPKKESSLSLRREICCKRSLRIEFWRFAWPSQSPHVAASSRSVSVAEI